MKLKPIITSLLDNDMYKFSMGQVIFHQFNEYRTTWKFECKNPEVTFTLDMVSEIIDQVEAYCELRFTEDELRYLRNLPGMKTSYIDYLRMWQPRRSEFGIYIDGSNNCGLSIETTGSWLNTSMYEVPILAIVSEVYSRMNYEYLDLLSEFVDRTDEKITSIGIHSGRYHLSKFSECGLRNRLSREAQQYAVSQLAASSYCSSTFVGTTNAHLAKKLEIPAVNIPTHEFVMCVGQGNKKHNPAYSNEYAMDAWIREYGACSGTAITDTVGVDVFLRDFNSTFATLFSGVQYDSGNPLIWADKMIQHYVNLDIDPESKILSFHDNLNFETADQIFRFCREKIKVTFGFSTYLSNDTSVDPLNIAMNVTMCNSQSIAKISEWETVCQHPEYVNYLKQCIHWRLYYNKD